ncbi:hypothetical protein HYU18_04175 [Candidatus Woesearchaeota archaeon]|nr:hypothetical protein [Candidatus Woesearchaeota archaeon]
MPYYSIWVREGMRRVGITNTLADYSEPVAAYLSLMAATLSSGANESRHEVIARFVNRVRGPMGAVVGSIYRGDCAVYYSGFYLQKPSSSDLFSVARESYSEASAALSQTTLIPGQFFTVMGDNLEGVLEALASVANVIVKPAVTREPFLMLAGKKNIDPRIN